MITHVAIRQDGKIYSLPEPFRHHHVIKTMARICELPTPINGEQGFLWTSEDHDTLTIMHVSFLTRRQAAKAMYMFGYMEEEKEELFSEDIW